MGKIDQSAGRYATIGRRRSTSSRRAANSRVRMTKAQWTRWGRGMCEGWSLEIGVAFRGTVVRQERLNQLTTWLAWVHAGCLGEYFDRATAMARVEDTIEHKKLVLEDWEVYRGDQRAKDSPLVRTSRLIFPRE